MTESRPPLQRTHTRKTEANRQDALDEGVKISHDGHDYVVRVGDITSIHARRFRKEVGSSFRSIMEELGEDPDIDSVAAVIWMARLIDGEDIGLDDVSFNYSDLDDIEVADAGAEKADNDPEG